MTIGRWRGRPAAGGEHRWPASPSAGEDLELDLVLLCARDSGIAALRDALSTSPGPAGICATDPPEPPPRNSRTSGRARNPAPSRSPPGSPLASTYDARNPHDHPPRKGPLP